MTEPTLKSKMLWNAGGNLVYMMAQWILTVVVGRMDFEAAGILSLGMSISATFQTLAMFGIHNYQVSDIDGKYSHSCYISFRVVSCVFAFAACILFAMTQGFGQTQFLAVALYMIFRLAESFSDVFLAIAQRLDRIDITGKSFFVKAVGLLILFLVTFIPTGNLNLGLLLMAGFSVASTFFFDVPSVRKLTSFRLWEPGTKKYALALETLPLCLYLFATTLISTLPKLLLESNTNEEVLGAYSSIFAPAVLISAAAGYLYNPFVLQFAKAYHDRDYKAFWSLLMKILAVIMVFAGITVALASLLGEFALVLLFGEKIIEYVYMLNPILIAIFANSIFILMGILESIMHDFKWLLLACGLGVAMELFLTAPFIAWFGANGASFVYALASVVAGIAMLLRMAVKLKSD